MVAIGDLSQHDALEYLHELRNALRHPGIEFPEVKNEDDVALYKQKIEEVKAHLATFPE